MPTRSIDAMLARPRQHIRSALIVSLSFLVAAYSWIFATDRILIALALDTQTHQQLERLKGLFFVSLCAGVIFLLVLRNVKPLVQATRLLREREREATARAEELAAVMDAVPAAVWIARDPGCLSITGNRYANELLRVGRHVNHSLTAEESQRPSH
ncbi:MAG: hypothetical protein KF768_09210, partial [Phycisphaeraceae bacterium]|nr:hypothetical protein [Phycisphaeraceae bacterium]